MKTWLEMDLRGLEAPHPLIQILSRLSSLDPGTGIIARTDRVPVFLLDELPRRGFRGETTPEGSSYVTRIDAR